MQQLNGTQLTPCLPRLNTNVRGSGFLEESVPSTTCVRFFFCRCKQHSGTEHQLQAAAAATAPLSAAKSKVSVYRCARYRFLIMCEPTLRVLAMLQSYESARTGFRCASRD